MKKLSTLFLALIATTALWASFTVDGIAYDFLGGDSVEVTYKDPYYDYSGSVTIPASVTYNSTTYRVTSIGDKAFYYCYSLSSVTIPNSVTKIGESAFEWCTSLSSITIPNSVTSIGEWVFAFCTSLTSITIGNSVTSIGYDAFSSCTSLSSVTIDNNYILNTKESVSNIFGSQVQTYIIGNSVTSIGYDAFFYCTSLSSITIPNSVTSIGEWAFDGCTSLSSITIPNSVTSIGEWVFAFCTSLSSINVDAANTHYASIDGVLFNYAKDTLIQYPVGNTRTSYTIPNSVISIGGGAFSGCTSLSSITIPNSVISIGGGAFSGCTSLSSITIPNSVTNIGDFAFSYCTSLTSITCYATTPPECDSWCFDYVDKSIPLYVPEGSIDAYKVANVWKDFTNIQAITTDIKNVNANANENANQKVMIDGHLLILKNGHNYTLSGTELW